MADLEDHTIHTTLLSGRLQLRQLRAGHRSGTDAILLAACIGAMRGELYDLGAGAGAAGLAVGLRNPDCRITLVEKEPELVAIAQDNISLNGMQGRARTALADITIARSRQDAGLKPNGADVLITNPPYQSAATSRVSPDALKARAHTFDAEAGSGLEEWVRACAALLRPGGTFAMIHRADALADVLAACGRRFGGLRILPVHPKHGHAATRLLVLGKAGSRAPLTILPGLILHEQDGGFTPASASLHAGDSILDIAGDK